MIAYFGWTNTILLNILNLRNSVYKDTKGHLYVMMNQRISECLLSAIEMSGSFDKIVRIYTDIPDLSGSKGFIEKLRALFGRRTETAFFEEVCKVMPPEGYDSFVTPAFWSMSLGLFRVLYRKNNKTEIHFVEEGYANYEGFDYLCRTLICAPAKERFYRFFKYGDVYQKARNAVKDNFLYDPLAYMSQDGLRPEKLLPFDLNNEIIRSVFSVVYKEYPDYQGKKVIYFSGSDDNLEPEITKQVISAIGGHRMVFRSLPSGRTDPEVPKGAVWDHTGLPAEVMFAFLNPDKTVLIARNSSGLVYPKRMFGKEPYVMYTFGMYNIEDSRRLPLEKYAGYLKNSYLQKERVRIAGNISDIETFINTVI